MQVQQSRQKHSAERALSRFVKYEQAKADYVARHPQATPAEYQKAMQHFARRFGV